ATAANGVADRTILVVCFNITLVAYLRDVTRVFLREAAADPARVTFLHWHGWARRVMGQLGRVSEWNAAFKNPATRSLNALGDLVKEAIEVAGSEAPIDRYDAVLVDEGQDLEPACWGALELALQNRSEGEMLLVADAA